MRTILGLVAAVFLVCIIGAVDGAMSEAMAGVGVAAGIVVTCLVIGLAPLVNVATRPLAVAVVVALGAFCAASALLPVAETLAPGDPAASAELHEIGQTVALPSGLDGPVRVFVHAELPPPPAHLKVVLSAAEDKLSTELESKQTSVRLGRRGRGKATRTHNSSFIDAELHGAPRLTLTGASGAWPVPIHVLVFREWLPDWCFLAGGAVLLLLASLLGAATGLGARVSGGVGCALFFGSALHYMATPDAALRSEIGALIIALVASAIVAPVLAVVSQRLVAPARPAS